MYEVLLGVGVFDVEVDGDQGSVVVVLEDVFGADLPGTVGFAAISVPFQALGKFLELNRLSFRVLFAAFRERLFIVPNIFCRAGAVEEKEVGGDAGVRSEDAVRQADDGVEVKVLEQVFFNPGANAVAEEGAVGDNKASPSRLGVTP